MNKKVLLSLLSLLLIPGCIKNGTSSDGEEKSQLLISEYVEGTGDITGDTGEVIFANRAIELYNFSDKDVDLSKYKIAHYRRDTTPEITVSLSGTLKAKSTYVVVTATSDETLKAKSDFVSNDLYFSGKGAVSLLLNDTVVDTIGYISLYTPFAEDTTLVRKVDHMTPKPEFDAYDYIKYAPDNFKYLGNVENSVTPEELLNGPCLDDKYLDLNQYPFYVNDGYGKFGGGGAVKASVKNNIDGDTSDLYVEGINPADFMDSTSYYGTTNKGTWLRSRYYGVDTPESGGNAGIQEFGMMAKYYTAFLQNKTADDMYVQTVKGDSLLGNFGRLLAYIWAGKNTLVNYETIKSGYSIADFDYHYDMMYKDIPYESYFYNANLYAQKNKLGRYGAKDPYWNYSSGKSYCQSLTCGNYFENGGSITA